MSSRLGLLAGGLGSHGFLLKEDWSRLHHSDEQAVQVVLQVPQLFPLRLRVGLKPHHKFDEVLPGLALELGQDLRRDPLVL